MIYEVTYYVKPDQKVKKDFAADNLFELVSYLSSKILYKDQFLSIEEIKLAKNLDN